MVIILPTFGTSQSVCASGRVRTMPWWRRPSGIWSSWLLFCPPLVPLKLSILQVGWEPCRDEEDLLVSDLHGHYSAHLWLHQWPGSQNFTRKYQGMHLLLFLPDVRLINKPDTGLPVERHIGYPFGYLAGYPFFFSSPIATTFGEKYILSLFTNSYFVLRDKLPVPGTVKNCPFSFSCKRKFLASD